MRHFFICKDSKGNVSKLIVENGELVIKDKYSLIRQGVASVRDDVWTVTKYDGSDIKTASAPIGESRVLDGITINFEHLEEPTEVPEQIWEREYDFDMPD